MPTQTKCDTCSADFKPVYHGGSPCPIGEREAYEYRAEVPTPAPEPEPEPAKPAPAGLEAVIIDAIGPHLTTLIDWSSVYAKAEEVARTEARNVAPVRVEVRGPLGVIHDAGVQHAEFPRLLAMLNQGVNVWLVGPAGTGKTSAAAAAAAAMGMEYTAVVLGPTSAAYDLIGYHNANGVWTPGACEERYRNGGVLLLDEIDNASGDSLVAANGLIGSKSMWFGKERAERHPDFRVVAGANTVGTGRDAVYIGRSQLDGATLDRFSYLRWGYDKGIEDSICSAWEAAAPARASQVRAWYTYVLRVRAVSESLEIRMPVSTRAIIDGASMIAGEGWTLEACANARFWDKMSPADESKVKAALK